ERARTQNDAAEKSATYVQIADLRMQVLSDVDGAALALREAMDADPDNQPAIEMLASLEEGRGDFSALEEVLLQWLSRCPQPERRPLLFRLAKNAREKLEDDDRA